MNEDPDFYKILNVNKNCTTEDLKKSYRKLSFKHHPDKNNGDDKFFKRITEAYTVLGDVKKRKQYDMERNMPNPEDLINMLFNGGFSAMGHGNMGAGVRRGNSGNMARGRGGGAPEMFNNIFTTFQTDGFFSPGNIFENFNMIKPIKHEVYISLQDIFNENTISTMITRSINNNNIIREETEEIQIKVPKNINSTKSIVVKGQGNIFNQNKGDIKVIFNIMEHEKFKLKNNDIYYNHTITLKESICGFSINLEYLDGKTYQINNKKNIIYPNYKKKINNLGLNYSQGVGSLYIVFNIKFPETITDENREIISNIL